MFVSALYAYELLLHCCERQQPRHVLEQHCRCLKGGQAGHCSCYCFLGEGQDRLPKRGRLFQELLDLYLGSSTIGAAAPSQD